MRVMIENADVVVTMNVTRDELSGTDILVEDGVIAALGPAQTRDVDEVIDASGCVVTPGLVNTHHHLYQTLTRAVPGGLDCQQQLRASRSPSRSNTWPSSRTASTFSF